MSLDILFFMWCHTARIFLSCLVCPRVKGFFIKKGYTEQ